MTKKDGKVDKGRWEVIERLYVVGLAIIVATIKATASICCRQAKMSP